MATEFSQYSTIDDGLDRKTLKTLKSRFLQVNNARLARMRSALINRQHVFIDVLPLLFHSNHPMLPGYVSHETPCGLTDYKPSKVDIQRGQRLARSFVYKHQPHRLQLIQGIFLMGSCGSVAQSTISDLDIWICYPDHLNHDAIELLRKKCDRISRWAQELHIEAHFFLMSGEKFRQGQREALTTEDCGTSQHFLLLDEFYRTGLLLAGRVPIWWLIPRSEDQHYTYYADTLRKKRFVKNNETIDFGGVGEIPPGEFIGAGVWQLYKAIDSPYKSVLKLLLIEVYASEYPNVSPLSNDYKQIIFANKLDINELDPYVMVYRKLEQYLLSRNELERLELIRRCFYFKVGKQLSKPSRTLNKSWQRTLMEKLVAEWSWDKDHLRELDARANWKINRVIEEQKQIVRELTNSYRFLLNFARKANATALINSQEMTVLGRKLYAAFERKAGKVETITSGIARNISEEVLSFKQIEDAQGNTVAWAAYPCDLSAMNEIHKPALKQLPDLIGLLCWCHLNGVLDNFTRTVIVNGKHNLYPFELDSIIRSLRQQLPLIEKSKSVDDEESLNNFSSPQYIREIHLFVNVGIDPLAKIRDRGIERLSDRTDSLGFSGLRENLILNIEQVSVNSWGEIFTRRYDGENALMDWLNDYLTSLPGNDSARMPQLDVKCFCPSRAHAIANRVTELVREIGACFFTGTRPKNSRYLIEFEHGYYCLQYRNGKPHILYLDGYDELLEHLSLPQTTYSPIVLDRRCLEGSALAVIAETSRPDNIQLFFQKNGAQTEVFVLDECSSLCRLFMPWDDEFDLLQPLYQFIESTMLRKQTESLDFNFEQQTNASWENIECYELVAGAHNTKLSRRYPEPQSANQYFSVQAIAKKSVGSNVVFDIYCDHQEFSALDWQEGIFDEVARFILSRRKSQERYPCYITDIDLSGLSAEDAGANDPANIQTATYLSYKQKLEEQLNKALQRIDV